MGYQDTIDYLFGLQKHGIKFGLENSRLLLDLLGAPHRKFRSVHIAGTNGKGSTARFLDAMLQSAGHRVGLYTSPHLVSFTERIRINSAPIPERRVVELAERLKQHARAAGGGAGMSPTFFEVTTAMAFAYFAEEGVDVAVVEAGMGGRLDATNLLAPALSVITNVELEHQEYLGSTIGEIAGEKAGIIKPRTPVVTGAVQPDAVTVIAERARENEAPLYRLNLDFGPDRVRRAAGQVFDYRGLRTVLADIRIGMAGRHQVDNACLALAAAEGLQDAGVVLPEDAVRRGMEQARWEGRLERVAERPDIILDGAHNPAAARCLAVELRGVRASYGRIVLVVGILSDKDARGILSELLPLADRVVFTRPSYARASDPGALAGMSGSGDLDGDVTGNVEEGIARARELAGPGDLIIVTGSLYVVGEARALLRGGHDAPGLAGLKG